MQNLCAGWTKAEGKGGRKILFCKKLQPSPLFWTTSTDQYEVQHSFWDENTYFLACLCLACVDDDDDDDDDDEDDVKEVDADNDNNIGSTDQYEVQHPFWDEQKYRYFLVCLCLACAELSTNQYTV